MILIPTCTSKFNKNFFHLTSPSKKKQLILGDEFTIIDCHTFYLKKFKRNVEFSLEHYKYYIDFIDEHKNESNLVFVYPDWDWIEDKSIVLKLEEYWISKHFQNKNFLLTNTTSFLSAPHIGTAGIHKWIDSIDSQWKHKFGKSSYINTNPNIIYTFDSQIANDKSLINEKLLRSTMLSIQTML